VSTPTTATPADDELIDRSQNMAYDLFDLQPGSASDGLLIVALATIDTRPTCLVLKLEQEEGVRTEEELIDGETAVRLIIEENLIWTANTKVFKTGLFVSDGNGGHDIVVTDVQTGKAGIAHYWRRFLACTYLETPDQATLRFYEQTVKWINESVPDPARRGDYVRALHTELSSNKRTFSPKKYVDDHLKGPDRSSLLDTLNEAGVPTAKTNKDTSRIGSALSRLSVKLDGIDITADSSAADRVQVIQLEDGQARVEASGKVRRISGSGR
jgi:hypothetical protein